MTITCYSQKYKILRDKSRMYSLINLEWISPDLFQNHIKYRLMRQKKAPFSVHAINTCYNILILL